MLLNAVWFLTTLSQTLAWQWEFTSPNGPLQCEQFGLEIIPDLNASLLYSVLYVPLNNSPSTSAFQITFPSDDLFDYDTQMYYPTGTSFVLVGNDNTTVGAGSTSNILTVGDSGDASCITNSHEPAFQWSLSTQSLGSGDCAYVYLSWGNDVLGTPSFLGVVPGGPSFSIDPLTNISSNGFGWSTEIVNGTTQVYVVASDVRGVGAGGVQSYVIGQCEGGESIGPTTSTTTTTTPAETTVTITGSSLPTDGSIGGAQAGGSNTRINGNLIAIVGGAVGGGLGFGILLTVIVWRYQSNAYKRRIRLLRLDGDSEDRFDPTYTNDPLSPEFSPEPYAPTLSPQHSRTTSLSSSYPFALHAAIAQSEGSMSSRSQTDSSTPLLSLDSNSRKVSPSSKLVLITQHEDAHTEVNGDDVERIELPPAYRFPPRIVQNDVANDVEGDEGNRQETRTGSKEDPEEVEGFV